MKQFTCLSLRRFRSFFLHAYCLPVFPASQFKNKILFFYWHSPKKTFRKRCREMSLRIRTVKEKHLGRYHYPFEDEKMKKKIQQDSSCCFTSTDSIFTLFSPLTLHFISFRIVSFYFSFFEMNPVHFIFRKCCDNVCQMHRVNKLP